MPRRKTRLRKTRQMLAEQITSSAPTIRDDRGGFVRPHDELNRLKGRHIKIDKGMAESLGIKPIGGKSQATRQTERTRFLAPPSEKTVLPKNSAGITAKLPTGLKTRWYRRY
jgi:hypothetical protein